MAGDRLAELRAALTRVYDQIEQALDADETADTTALEEHANAIQDELDAFLALKGTEVQEQIRRRPRPDPPAGSGRLF